MADSVCTRPRDFFDGDRGMIGPRFLEPAESHAEREIVPMELVAESLEGGGATPAASVVDWGMPASARSSAAVITADGEQSAVEVLAMLQGGREHDDAPRAEATPTASGEAALAAQTGEELGAATHDVPHASVPPAANAQLLQSDVAEAQLLLTHWYVCALLRLGIARARSRVTAASRTGSA